MQIVPFRENFTAYNLRLKSFTGTIHSVNVTLRVGHASTVQWGLVSVDRLLSDQVLYFEVYRTFHIHVIECKVLAEIRPLSSPLSLMEREFSSLLSTLAFHFFYTYVFIRQTGR